MSITRPLILLLLLVLLSVSTQADESTPPPQPAATTQPASDSMKLSTSVVQVLDRRSSIDSILNRCSVELLFIGKPMSQVIGIDHIKVTQARDNAGNNLIDKELQINHSLGQDDMLRRSGSPANSAGMSIMLKNPPRTATQITSIKGQVSFVLKTVEGKDYVRLTDFMQQTGKPIESDALKDRGVQVIYLPPQWIKDWAVKQDDHKKRPLAADELAGLLPLIQGIAQQGNSVTLIPMFINDPQKQLAQIQITTAQGNLRKVQFEQVTVFVSFSSQAAKPTLEVNLKSDDTIMTLPFEIGDIPLP